MAGDTLRPPAAGALSHLLRFIDENLSGDLSVPALAARAGLGARQLGRAFVAATGMSPRLYVERRRALAAAHLLEQEPLALADVALRCGFTSVATLSRAFRRELQVSPGRYRAGAKLRTC